MAGRSRGAKLLAGTFSDAGRAQDAFDGLMQDAGAGTDVDVAFLGSDGQFVVLVQAKSQQARERAFRVLVDHDAVLSANSERYTTAALPEMVQRWLDAFSLLSQSGQLGSLDLLALAVTRRREEQDVAVAEKAPSSAKTRQRVAAADAELRQVSEKLESALRVEHPDLFDRRGRLRKSALSRTLMQRAGGKRRLSGADLRALEDSADAGATRSAHAP